MVIGKDRRRQQFLKDDYVRDMDDIIYLVILNDHPLDSVVVIPKYVPAPGGKWLGSYARLFRNYTSEEFHQVSGLAKFRRYQFCSNSFGKKLLAIPKNLIAEHYVPETKLTELMLASGDSIDPLKKKALTLANILMEMGIDQCRIGITGSLLYDLHMPFSNLNVILYGLKPVEIYLSNIDEIVAESRYISFKSQALDLGNKHVNLRSRIKTFLWTEGISTAIHVNEFPDFQFVYGSETVHSLSNCEITGTIFNVREGFVRKTYSLHPTEVMTWPDTRNDPPDTLRLRIVSGRSEDIVFREGELVRACGLLQWIDPLDKKQQKPFFQLSVGLEEFPGYGYPVSISASEV